MKKKDKIDTYNNWLQKHIDNKNVVKIFRTFRGNEINITGFILSMTKDFLLLQVINEFMIDGFSIIRRDQFEGSRCNKFEKACKKILQAEGIIDKYYGIGKSISLTSWQDIFLKLKELDYHIILECENKRNPKFLIGPIQEATKNKISIQYYDATGKLDKKFSDVKYKEITRVTFGDGYSTTFRKYLRTTKMKEQEII